MNNEYVISGIILGAIAIGLLLIPIWGADTNIFLQNNPASANFTDTTVCLNVGDGKLIVKSSTDGNCEIKSLKGSSDISLTNDSNTITIDFNGTINGESTQCINVGTGTIVIKNSTNGNCFVKSFLAGTGLSISNSSTTITYTNTLPENTICSNSTSSAGHYGLCKDNTIKLRTLFPSTGISMSLNGTDIIISSTVSSSQETTVCNNLGSGRFIVRNSTSGNCNIRSLLNGTGITLSNSSTTITITNSKPEQGCSFAGGTSWWKTESTCLMKGITTGNDITLTTNTNDLNVKVTTTSCSATKQFLVDIGPATCGNGFYQLCTNSLGSSATSLSCSGFTAKRHLFITWELRIVTSSYTPGIRFNSDSGTNYAWRTSGNGGADTTSTSATEIQTGLASNAGGGNIFFCNVYNNQAGDRKLMTCFGANGLDTNSGTLPGRAETSGKWSNTSAQITTVDIIRQAGTGSLNTGSTVTVWGYD